MDKEQNEINAISKTNEDDLADLDYYLTEEK
jgi:hypothetical protein